MTQVPSALPATCRCIHDGVAASVASQSTAGTIAAQWRGVGRGFGGTMFRMGDVFALKSGFKGFFETLKKFYVAVTLPVTNPYRTSGGTRRVGPQFYNRSVLS